MISADLNFRRFMSGISRAGEPYQWQISLSLLVLVCFSQVILFPFVTIDDASYIYENPRVKSGLSLSNLAWAFTSLPDACGNGRLAARRPERLHALAVQEPRLASAATATRAMAKAPILPLIEWSCDRAVAG